MVPAPLDDGGRGHHRQEGEQQEQQRGGHVAIRVPCSSFPAPSAKDAHFTPGEARLPLSLSLTSLLALLSNLMLLHPLFRPLERVALAWSHRRRRCRSLDGTLLGGSPLQPTQPGRVGAE